MKSNTVVCPFVCGLVCLSMVFAIPVSVLSQVLRQHSCEWKDHRRMSGSIGCVDGSVGPNAPCVGTFVIYDEEIVCEPNIAEWDSTCTVVKLKKTEYHGEAKSLGLFKKAACFGVPVTCLGCAIAAVVAGAFSDGGGYVIGSGLCSAIGCVGTIFFNPLECCYTECTQSKKKVVSDWIDGCRL